jgi:hypothetical protein
MAISPLFAALATDELAWDVYADELEEQGELARAATIRAARVLRESPSIAHARAVIAAAEGLPRAWLEGIPRRRSLLEARVEITDTFGRKYYLYFPAGGGLRFRIAPDSEGDGRWIQIGDAMAFSVAGYSKYEGLVGEGIGSDTDQWTFGWTMIPIDEDGFWNGAGASGVGNEARSKTDPSMIVTVRDWP